MSIHATQPTGFFTYLFNNKAKIEASKIRHPILDATKNNHTPKLLLGGKESKINNATVAALTTKPDTKREQIYLGYEDNESAKGEVVAQFFNKHASTLKGFTLSLEGGIDSWEPIATEIAENEKLKDLRIIAEEKNSSSSKASPGTHALMQAIGSTCITWLGLVHLELDNQGLTHLTTSIKTLPLKTLHLIDHYNSIYTNEDGMLALATAISQHKYMEDFTFLSASLCLTPILAERMLDILVAKNDNLTHIDICSKHEKSKFDKAWIPVRQYAYAITNYNQGHYDRLSPEMYSKIAAKKGHIRTQNKLTASTEIKPATEALLSAPSPQPTMELPSTTMQLNISDNAVPKEKPEFIPMEIEEDAPQAHTLYQELKATMSTFSSYVTAHSNSTWLLTAISTFANILSSLLSKPFSKHTAKVHPESMSTDRNDTQSCAPSALSEQGKHPT